MNLWKATGIFTTTALVGTMAYSIAKGHGLDVREAVAGPQPNMEEGARRLRSARSFLERGEHNKGGHRVKAIELTDKAVEEVDKGIAAAD